MQVTLYRIIYKCIISVFNKCTVYCVITISFEWSVPTEPFHFSAITELNVILAFQPSGVVTTSSSMNFTRKDIFNI